MFKTKRMLSLILALIMAFSMLSVMGIGVSADNSDEPRFTVITDGTDPVVGKRYTIKICIENAKALKNADIGIRFDNGNLKRVDYSKPSDAKYQNDMFYPYFNDKISENITFSEPFTGDTAVYEFWFVPTVEGATDIEIFAVSWNCDSAESQNAPEKLTYTPDVLPNKTVFDIDVTDKDPQKGDTFKVTVSVKNALFFESMKIHIGYDKNLLDLIDMQPVDNLTGDIFEYNTNGTLEYKHEILFPDDYDYGMSGDIDLCVITFRVLEGGTYTLNIDVKDWVFTNQPENATLTLNGPIPDAYVVERGYLRYRVANGAATVISCDENANGPVAVAEKIDGFPVTAIADSVFANRSSITEITLPRSIETIGKDAFRYATSLKKINIPAKVKVIPEGAFFKCPALATVTVNQDNQSYVNGTAGIVLSKDKKTLVLYPAGLKEQSFTIPGSIEEIAPYAFCSAENLISVGLSTKLRKIGDCAFLFAYNIDCIVIPSNVTEISASAFSNTGIRIAVIGEGVKKLDCNLFYNCAHLERIVIPVSVTEICKFAVVSGEKLEIFYNGTEAEWNKIKKESPIDAAAIHYSAYNELYVKARYVGVTQVFVQGTEEFKSAIGNRNHIFAYSSGSAVPFMNYIATGYFVKIYNTEGVLVDMKQMSIGYDVNGDASVTPADARLALRAAAKLEKLSGVYKMAADINGDNSITPTDARLILRKSAGLA